MGSYLIETEGVVTELLPNILFRVQLNDGSQILGSPSRQMQKNYIPISTGDRVKVGLVSRESTQGCITCCFHNSR